MSKRVFIIVLDSFGIGEMPDAETFGDAGSNTLASIVKDPAYSTPNLQKLGLFNIEGVNCGQSTPAPLASFARLEEQCMGKDSTVGHWEIAGVVAANALPTYPNGFPIEVIQQFEERTGHKVACNKPYSGTELLKDYGAHHMETGELLVYTSADSVFQIAAHEEVVPLPELYRCCEIAREMLCGEHGVGRVIARPFTGTEADGFTRTRNRHDYSLTAPGKTVLRYLQEAGLRTISVGKIYDLFAGEGLDESHPTQNNAQGMEKTIAMAQEDFEGLCFVNLVDFDMVYGHRNDVPGYARAATEFDAQLGELLPLLRDEDLLIITADHGCDPATPSTDHSREYVPMLAYGPGFRQGVDLGTRYSFGCIANTVADFFGVKAQLAGESFFEEII
ncbi:phosphopentomutase [Ruminococcaceae bacterium OttesenSCG-928-N02]|nr:phosphopentomutase [Ruminococcaceae bacterium OttesenSCG-928-N02]